TRALGAGAVVAVVTGGPTTGSATITAPLESVKKAAKTTAPPRLIPNGTVKVLSVFPAMTSPCFTMGPDRVKMPFPPGKELINGMVPGSFINAEEGSLKVYPPIVSPVLATSVVGVKTA